ncbi:uncharacterized protein LOC142550096 [Primulina tabacum]|uniref:uncharacterized protein LOC142550096 n=1 Tax=Primulina tabacum TaxID=48773 RepID=UPI003F5929BA
MAKRIAIEIVDRSLQDITGIQKPFGGKVVVLEEDFMQVLPVVPKATIQETINASSGIEPTDIEGNIKIPDDMIINIAKMMGSEGKKYASFDEAIDDTQNFYPQEFLNTLTPNGMPHHSLVLKKTCTIMLLRNLDPSEGMCNGTRMVCKEFEDNVIHAVITVGHHAGKHVFIPRIPLSPAENEGYPFQLRRKQFPIRLCLRHKVKLYQLLVYTYHNLFFTWPIIRCIF